MSNHRSMTGNMRGLGVWLMLLVLFAPAALADTGSPNTDSFLQPMPWILEMSVNPNRTLRDDSCAHCEGNNPLGAMCCGMCAFWENPRSQAAIDNRKWEGPCNERLVGQLLVDLKGWGVDLENLKPSDLFDTIKGRTLWFIGDSQTQYWYLAVECFLSHYLAKAPRAAPTNSSAANLWLVKFDEWRELKGSPKASPKPAVCAELQENTRVCFVRVHLVEEIAHPVLRVIKKDVPNSRRDIAVINSGLHYGVWDGKYEAGFDFLKTFIKEHKEELPHIIWKDTSPQHFEYENGYYWWIDDSRGKTAGGPPPEKCRPFTEEELQSNELKAGGWYNSVAFKHMREVDVPLLDAFQITLPMWQMHMKDKDCSHYCSPGAYEVWTYLLTDMLKGTALRD